MFIKLVVIILLLLLLFNIKILVEQWLNPAYIMILYWALNIITTLFVIGNSYQWQIGGLIWIIIACAFFSFFLEVGAIVAQKSVRHSAIDLGEKSLNKNSWRFLLVCLIIGMIRLVSEISINGFTVQMFFDLNTLLEMNTKMAYSRYYGGGISYGVVMQVMLAFIYAGPLIGGYAFVYSSHSSERRLCVVTLIPAVGIVLFANTKSVIIASVMLWLSGYVTGYLEKYKKAPTIKLRNLLWVLLGGLVLVSLLYISMMLRIGKLNSQIMMIVNKKFVSYAFGELPAFDYWFSNYASNIDPTYGKYTFYGIFQALGISHRGQGVYSDFIYAGEITTNVYTVFRGIVNDFGIFGGVAFFIFFGFVAGYAYQYVLHKSHHNTLAKVVLAGTYFFIFFSYLVSAWTYVSFILAFFIFTVYLGLSDYKLIWKANRRSKRNIILSEK